MIIKVLSHPLVALIASIVIAVSTALSPYAANIIVIIFAAVLSVSLLIHAVIMTIRFTSKRSWLRSGSNFLLKNVEHEWKLTSDASLYMKSIYTIKNTGSTSVRSIPFDNIGWFRKPDVLKISIDLPEKLSNSYRIRTIRHAFYDALYSFINGNIHFISWSLVIDPPLEPSKEVTYIVKIYTEKTETDAFSSNGSYAGFPANFPTQKAVMRFVAPAGYRFEILNGCIIIDDSGEEIFNNSYTVKLAKTSFGAGVINWNHSNLKSGVRYLFKYKILKDGK